VSQPDMEEPRGYGDLRGLPFPLGDWAEPAERLEELYRWAEEGAVGTAQWYLANRVWKRRWARALRVGAALFAAAGGTLVLVDVRWAYASLLLAAVCVGMDRCFGLTSGWMRSMATAQAVQRRLEALRFDWSSESVREVLGPAEGTAAEATERCLGVLRRFCEDISELVRTETADWMVDFRAGSAPLRTQSVVPWSAPRSDGAAPSRFPLGPAGRPNMPRQRPPEGPRAS